MMTSLAESMVLTVDRDSVCAGDDCTSHARSFSVPCAASLSELIHQAKKACELAGISGGKATWIVEAGGYDGMPIAVVAQQWDEARALITSSTTIDHLFADLEKQLFFKYWCQANPETVFDALVSNSPLPSRYAS
ncbi:hypothetical protein [Aquitalea pelogenes]|uniref:hypothetical protein n=1 Tax=Aquitalea pelogenes TaxID=1293573 RepID=UPI0035B43924